VTAFSRRRLVAGAGTAAIAGVLGVRDAAAATEDELAFANFGLAAELLLVDFYGRATEAGHFSGRTARDLRLARRSAREHAAALTRLLADAGETAATAEDFEFDWPADVFASAASAAAVGLTIAEALLGTYLAASTATAGQAARSLYVRMVANLARQVAVLGRAAGGRGVGVSFPPPLTLEEASDRIEGYLG
jgi:hypothetical protein